MKDTSRLLRLWIVLSLLWVVPVASFAWLNFPDISEAQEERIRGMYEILIEREKRINPEFEERYANVTAAGLAEDIVREGKADGYAANILDKWKGEIDFSSVERKFDNARRQIPVLRLRCIGLAAVAWSLPVVLSFFLGWAVIRNRDKRMEG